MKLNRFGAVLSVLTSGALALSACGSDNNATGGGPAPSSTTVSCGGKKALKASGSTAQANAMTRFVKAFEQACPGQTLNYTGNGSGGGIRDFNSSQTDFGGSDSPLVEDEAALAEHRCNGAPVWNLPVVFGPIAVTYNINGVTALNLDAATLAKIFHGAVNTWNDPAIAALNAGANLPATPIRVVFRSDESGTTDNFQRYLDAASNGAWGKGGGKAFKGDVGEGVKGNDGTAAATKNTEGSISYNEWSFAQAQQLNIVKIVTSGGPEPVTIGADTVGKTIAGAKFSGQGNDLVLDTVSFYRPTQPGSYPIVLATYEIVCSKYPDAESGVAVKAFLQSTIGSGQNGLGDNGYVPIPDSLKSRLSTAVNAIS